MASYRITTSFDVDNIPDESVAQEIADAVALTLHSKYEKSFITSYDGRLLGHRISNVNGHRPLIITNE